MPHRATPSGSRKNQLEKLCFDLVVIGVVLKGCQFVQRQQHATAVRGSASWAGRAAMA